MNITHKMWVVGIGLMIAFWVMEVKADSPTSSNTSIEQESSVFDRGSSAHTLYLSASVNEGYSSLANSTTSITGSGPQTEILGLATLELGHWAIEAGGGWLYSSLSGGSSASDSTNGILSLSSYSMATEAGVVELSPQYHLTDHLTLGPVGELLIGPNVGFNPNIGGDTQSMAFLAGAQALYGFRVGPVDMHAGARYLTSLNIPNQQLQSVEATLQFGIPLF